VTFRDGINKGDAYMDWNTWQNIDPNAGNTTGLNDGVITTADIKEINHYYPLVQSVLNQHLRVPKTGGLASNCVATRTIYGVSDARQVLL
jgi:hypothetical protein